MAYDPTRPLPAGAELNQRYKICKFIGHGGFAMVYEADDPVIGRRVAIKLLNPVVQPDEKARRSTLERFRREAMAAARIRHPNVVTIYDMGTLQETEQPFIVMELLTGYDIEHELQTHGAMSARRVLPLMCKALDALHQGHQEGIVHRDLKPSNLFLINPRTEREDVRILDFGIARLDRAEGRLTGTGDLVGTPSYVSPEYVRGDKPTPAMDVYQMALILVEMLTGRVVVLSDNPMTCLWQHVQRDFHLPDALLQSELGSIVVQALAGEPSERPSAAAFSDALVRINPAHVPMFAVGAPSRPLKDVSGTFGRGGLSGAGPATPVLGVQVPVPVGVNGVTADMALAAGGTVRMSEPAKPASRGAGATTAPQEAALPVASGASARSLSPALLGGVLVVALLALGAVGYLGYTLLQDKPAPPAPVVDKGEKTDKSEKTDKGEKMDKGGEPSAGGVVAAQPDAGAPQPDAGGVAAQPDAGPAEKDAGAPAAVTQQVEVQAVPPNAVVYVGDKELGPAPQSVTFQDDQPQKITLKAKGYQDLSADLKPSDGPSASFKLKPKAVVPKDGGTKKGGGGGGWTLPD